MFLVPSFCFPFYSCRLETKEPVQQRHTGHSILVPRLWGSSSAWAEQGLEAVLLSTLHKDEGFRSFLFFIINRSHCKASAQQQNELLISPEPSYHHHSSFLARPFGFPKSRQHSQHAFRKQERHQVSRPHVSHDARIYSLFVVGCRTAWAPASALAI